MVSLRKEHSMCLHRNEVEVFEGQRQVVGQSGGGSGCSASPGSLFSAGWAAS